MLLTISQFAHHKGLSARHVQRLAAASSWTSIDHQSVLYRLVKTGSYDVNGKPIFAVEVPDAPITRRHLSKEEKEALFMRMVAGEDGHNLACEFGVSYTAVFRLKKTGTVSRKRRKDAGARKIDWIPRNARDTFDAIYLGSAQKNAKYAMFLVERELGGVKLSYRLALSWASELNAQHTLRHQAARFERDYTPHIRRDLWGEYEFMEQVLFDCWKADLWVKHGNTQVQPRLVVAIDLKTRHILSYKVMARDANAEDVMDVALDLVYRWGRPGMFLMDNGPEFTNVDVQRFVRGLWSTEEHEARERIIFSEAYHPQSKGAIERLFRIFKDEFCVFSSSYSPNPVDSRKPTKRLSHVAGDMTIGEFKVRFNGYMTTGVFMSRPRIMWMNPHYSRRHEANEGRPLTMTDAIDRAYATHEKIEVDPKKLAVLFAKTFRKEVRRGSIAITYAGVRYMYIPDEIPPERIAETFDLLVNPMDMSRAWVLDLAGTVVTEAREPRLANVAGGVVLTRERASEVKKIRNRVIKHTRAAASLKREIDGLAIVSRGDTSAVNAPGEDTSRELVYANIHAPSSHVEAEELGEDYLRGAINCQNEEEFNQ